MLNNYIDLMKQKNRESKIYIRNGQSITMNNDNQHQKITEGKVEEAKHVQQKKQIDKLLQAIVKQRLFGNFLEDNNKLSLDSAYNIDMIYRSKCLENNRPKRMYARPSQDFDRSQKRSTLGHHYTIDLSRSCLDKHEDQYRKVNGKKRNYSQKLPILLKKQNDKKEIVNTKSPIYHTKKLDVNQKVFGQTFRKWFGTINNNAIIYELKISRESIINKLKNIIDGKIIQRFFHFFGFPQAFGLRQYCNLIQGAANCNLKFIYFWVFSVFDEVNNGVLNSQDLFRFMQKFPSQNQYLQQQVFRIQKYLSKLSINFKPRQQKDSQIPVQQLLVINHGLKLQQLKVLMKQSNKQIIDVDCLKNTCYHQTILSLDHDPMERIKKSQIQKTEMLTKKIKLETLQQKKKLKNTPGLRLRDFYAIFGVKRPKIFCYILSLLAGVKAADYQ